MKKSLKSFVEYMLIIALTIGCTLLAVNVYKQIVAVNKQNIILNNIEQKSTRNSNDVSSVNVEQQQEQ